MALSVNSMLLRETPVRGNAFREEHRFIVEATGGTAREVYVWATSQHDFTGPSPPVVERPDFTEATGAADYPIEPTWQGLPLTDVQYETNRDRDPEIYFLTAIYSDESSGGGSPPSLKDPGTQEFAFDIAPENEHFRFAIEETGGMGPAGDFRPDFNLAINVTEDGSIEGVQMPSSSQIFTIKFTQAAGWFDATKRNLIGRTRGHTNSTAMTIGGVTYAIGEVRFLGASGRIAAAGNSDVEFRFGVRENRAGITVTGLSGSVSKPGWQYMWVYYAKGVDSNGKASNIAKGAYVYRLVPESDLNALLA